MVGMTFFCYMNYEYYDFYSFDDGYWLENRYRSAVAEYDGLYYDYAVFMIYCRLKTVVHNCGIMMAELFIELILEFRFFVGFLGHGE